MNNENYIEITKKLTIEEILNKLKVFSDQKETKKILIYLNKDQEEILFKNKDFHKYKENLDLYIKLRTVVNSGNNNIPFIINNLIEDFKNDKEFNKYSYHITIPMSLEDSELIKKVIFYFNEYIKNTNKNYFITFDIY